MKKVGLILIFLSILSLSSCPFWNATKNNIIRTYVPGQPLGAGLGSDFYLLKDSNYLIYSINSETEYSGVDGLPYKAGVYTEVIYLGTDGWYQSYWYDGTEGFGPAIPLEKINRLPDGQSLYSSGEWGATIPEYSDKVIAYAPVTALKGSYGYAVSAGGSVLEVYDAGSWNDSIDLEPVEEQTVYSDNAAPPAVGSIDLDADADGAESVRLMQVFDDLLLICCASENLSGGSCFLMFRHLNHLLSSEPLISLNGSLIRTNTASDIQTANYLYTAEIIWNTGTSVLPQIL